MKKVNAVKVAMFAYRNGLTIDELAAYLELSVEELNKNVFSNKTNYDLNIIINIANKLGLKIEELLIE